MSSPLTRQQQHNQHRRRRSRNQRQTSIPETEPDLEEVVTAAGQCSNTLIAQRGEEEKEEENVEKIQIHDENSEVEVEVEVEIKTRRRRPPAAAAVQSFVYMDTTTTTAQAATSGKEELVDGPWNGRGAQSQHSIKRRSSKRAKTVDEDEDDGWN